MYQKSIGGVCAAFANYLDVDLALMRIIWLCTAIFTGVGFIVYLVCWIVIPADWTAAIPQQQPVATAAPVPPPQPEGHESGVPA
jgi:phage shock protein PspC (stress-responsive transcriptional regulator)